MFLLLPSVNDQKLLILVVTGGTYSGELRQNQCTHLVVDDPKGQKYEFAKKWKIHYVTSKWFYDSLEKGACLDENLYAVEESVRNEQGTAGKFVKPTSTPKRKSRQTCELP
ncbi:DNA topoisomerase 2-binding protein 1-like [Ptychodera flava]|uniref:DNA topoisomerase 2-binding protein 1-like n=1 Tax=Ptychodera flava TaxID=63121 RepID=UPI00396A8762